MTELPPNDDNINSSINDEITPESDLSNPNRRIWVVTTASLPWRTGTAVNPLARALYLTRGRPKHYVTLCVPWVNHDDQVKIFGPNIKFDTQQQQELWIRNYCRDRVNCEKEADDLKILFYDSMYLGLFGSIFPMVDICSLIPDEEADIAILEEPEHLNWFRVPPQLDDKQRDAATETEKIATEKAELGWSVKFKHVVGILHTNYTAYMHQYGMGTSFIAASALGALSSIVVRAYCHKLIRLSGTLPHLDEQREVTCNVHGVRSEFLDKPNPVSQSSEYIPNPIYFIGKLIWAKGFDKLLDIQEDYREETGEYFPLDIYGGGGNETDIRRAFLGRQGIAKTSEGNEFNDGFVKTLSDKTAALIFRGRGSLRGQLEDGGEQIMEELSQENDGLEALGIEDDVSKTMGSEGTKRDSDINPIEVLGSLSGRTKDTGLALTSAVGILAEKVVGLGLTVAFSEKAQEPAAKDSAELSKSAATTGGDAGERQSSEVKQSLRFDPPKSRFELRRHPIPARFLGVKDHALIRDIPEHKIFLNLSTTEVLCTTTAEALAMGKFVIIPNHPSNEFFLQFGNCLAYNDKKECIEKIKWALENDPKPLTQDHIHAFSWEGATERLFNSAGLTRSEADRRIGSGTATADRDAARFHVESGRKGQFIQQIIQRRGV